MSYLGTIGFLRRKKVVQMQPENATYIIVKISVPAEKRLSNALPSMANARVLHVLMLMKADESAILLFIYYLSSLFCNDCFYIIPFYCIFPS